MGKKGKKSFYKKQLKPFVKNNQVLLAALGGAAAGISLANILGTEKGKQVLDTIESTVKGISTKINNTFSGEEDKPLKHALK